MNLKYIIVKASLIGFWNCYSTVGERLLGNPASRVGAYSRGRSIEVSCMFNLYFLDSVFFDPSRKAQSSTESQDDNGPRVCHIYNY